MSTRTAPRPVTPDERVSDVLARDESLLAVFERQAPPLGKLRIRAMRRVMARLVTVEQAARMAGVSAAKLTRALNEALGIPQALMDADTIHPTATGATVADTSWQHHAAASGGPANAFGSGASGMVPRAVHAEPRTRPPSARVVELDVREDLRAGREPFSRIMAAVAALGEHHVLHLRATFEPVPLVAVLAKRGFACETHEHAADDWSAWFWRPESGEPGAASKQEQGAATALAEALPHIPDDAARGDIVWLDVRGLEPPEPLVRTLAALEMLPAGHTLVQVNLRVPQFLFPLLAERGFSCALDDSAADRVLVRIWRST